MPPGGADRARSGGGRDQHRDLGHRLPARLELGRLPFLDAEGYPVQRRGVTTIPGLYILGLDWLHSAKSGLFAGIGEDAAYLATRLAEQPGAH